MHARGSKCDCMIDEGAGSDYLSSLFDDILDFLFPVCGVNFRTINALVRWCTYNHSRQVPSCAMNAQCNLCINV